MEESGSWVRKVGVLVAELEAILRLKEIWSPWLGPAKTAVYLPAWFLCPCHGWLITHISSLTRAWNGMSSLLASHPLATLLPSLSPLGPEPKCFYKTPFFMRCSPSFCSARLHVPRQVFVFFSNWEVPFFLTVENVICINFSNSSPLEIHIIQLMLILLHWIFPYVKIKIY